MPPNIGFEDGSLNHWNCAAGKIVATDSTSTIILGASNPIPGRHTIFSKYNSAGVMDYYGNFPILCPNGSDYSIRLGNDSAGAQAESVSYSFFVPPAPFAYSITFNYAVVLQNPPHKYFEQPRFTARVYDVAADKYADCPSFDFVAGSALPGFQLSTRKLKDSDGTPAPVFYKEWSSATIDMRPYSGKLMRLVFTTNDCTFSKHFGYAYIDVDETNSSQPIRGNTYCEGEKSILLKGPIGFADYKWYNADMSEELSTGQVLEISPPPPDQTEYALKITPYPDLGCEDVLYTVINKINNGYKLKVVDTVRGCPETGVDLTTPDITTGSTPGMTYSYFSDVAGTYIRDPKKVMLPGTYFIQGLSPDGCTNTLPIQVKLTAPVIKVNQPPPIRYPNTFDITTAFQRVDSLTYSYYMDAYTTIPLENYTAINKTGRYFIKVENKSGCVTVTDVEVTLLPPLPYVVTAPNLFTPNNDGVNDTFSLHIEGFVQFNNLSIYNRYGQLVYNTKSQADLWNGNLKNRPLPDGTYYWMFNGLDTYHHTKITKSGYVEIIR